MAAKVFLRSTDQRTIEKVKRSKAEALVRQLFAVQVERYLYQRVIRGMVESEIPEDMNPMEPVIDKRLGVRFEDPCKMPNMPRFRRLNGYERMQQCEL